MTMHPQVAAMLAGLAQAGIPPFHQMPLEQARATFRQLLGSAPPSQQTVAKVEDRAEPGQPWRLRLYTPPGPGPHPVLMFYHGGGWVLGDLDSYEAVCRELCGAVGCLVVSVDYRLAPEHRFPAAADDAFAALQWVVDHAGALNAKSDCIAVAGDSAGGNLAAITAQQARTALPGRVRGQLLIYPVAAHYDDGSVSMRELATGYFLTRGDMVWFTNHYLGPEADKHAPRFNLGRAPLHRELPPALVITAEYDPLRDEGEAFAQALQRAGVEVTQTRHAGAIHGFVSFFAALDVGRAAMTEACRWLQARFAT